MNIAICDDEARDLQNVKAAAENYVHLRKDRQIRIDFFSHPEDLIEACEKNGGYHIYILDVVMPDMTGIRLGQTLRNMGCDGKIIYLTSSEEYSLDAFKVKAFDYLIKPVREEPFFKTLDEAIAQIAEKQDKYILIKSKARSIKLTYQSIVYAELTRRAVCYYLADGRCIQGVTLRTTFPEAMAELLADRRFVLCGQSMLVNLDHITEIENDAVVFGKTYRPPMGEKNCRKLRSIWSEYLFAQEG